MKRSMRSMGALLFMSVLGVLVCLPGTMRAQQLGAPFFGRSLLQPYYQNNPSMYVCGWYNFVANPVNNFDGMMPNWETTAMNVDSFIESFRVRLFSSVDYDRARASAIMNMMMGINATDPVYDGPSANRWENGVAYAQNPTNWARWENIVRAYDAAGRANFNDRHIEVDPIDWLGATYDGGGGDPCGPTATPMPDTRIERLSEFINDEAVTFKDEKGDLQFSILKKCANIMGLANLPLTPPPPPPPPASAKCGPSMFASSNTMLFGSSTVLRPSALITGYPPNPSSDPVLNLRIQRPDGSVQNVTSMPYAAQNTPSGTLLTANGYTFTPGAGGVYNMQWQLVFPAASAGLNITCPGAGTISASTAPDPSRSDDPKRGYGTGDTDKLYVGYRPFFGTIGGDVVAGDALNLSSGVRSWNRGAGGGYVGAASHIAALATGNIEDFVTGGGLAGGRGTDTGSGLALANDSSAKTGTTYGGKYTSPAFSPPAAPSAAKPWTAGATMDLSDPTLQSGIYTYTGDITVSGTLPANKHVTLYVTDGSVYIPSDITYGPYGALTGTPRFNVFVNGGNIYVGSGVSELHGIFNASGAGTKGIFYSCASGVNTPVDLNGGYDTCNNQLTVYGAVAARQLILSRTYGSLMGATVEPAEKFVYTPEMWLAPLQDNPGVLPVRYNSYVSLPPIL